MTTQIAAAQPVQTSAKPLKRRLSRQVSADVVAICDILAMVIGGLLPALIYAVAGKVVIDQVMVMQSVLVAGFIAHLCLRFRGMYETSHMASFPLDPMELMIAVICGMVGVLGIGLPLALRNMHIAVWYAAWVSASFCLMLYGRMMARNILAKFATDWPL